MVKRGLLVVLAFVSGAVSGSPFLTADPQCHDPTGVASECPNGYEYSADQGGTWAEMDSEITGDAIVIMHDMASFSPGAHDLVIRAYNAWSVSDEVPFSFTAGVPAPPGGFRVSAPPQ